MIYFDPTEVYDFHDYLLQGQAQELVEGVKTASEIPPFIAANKAPFVDRHNLQDHHFAILIKEGGETYRRFPIRTIADTWLSQKCFEKNFHKMPVFAQIKTASFLKQSCDFFGIEASDFILKCAENDVYKNQDGPPQLVDYDDQTIQYYEDLSKQEKQAEERWAVPSEEAYPLNNQREVQVACDYLKKNASDLQGLGQFDEFATNLKVACMVHSVNVPDFVDLATSDTSEFNKSNFDYLCSIREKLAFDLGKSKEEREDIKGQLMKLGEDVQLLNKQDALARFYSVDKMLGISAYVGIPDPNMMFKGAFDGEPKVTDISTEETFTRPDHTAKHFDSSNLDQHSMDFIRKLASEKPEAFSGFFSDEEIVKIARDPGMFIKGSDGGTKLLLKKVMEEHYPKEKGALTA